MLLVGVKACHTVTQKLRVGHTRKVCPTSFLFDVKKSVGPSIAIEGPTCTSYVTVRQSLNNLRTVERY